MYWSLIKERQASPMIDRYLLDNLRAVLRATDIDGQHAYWLPTIGFLFGRLHGAILSPKTGTPRPDVTALASFQNKNAARGYGIGRQYYFLDAQPDECSFTDVSLIERLQETERESVEFRDEEGTWYYTLGCLLGELSGQLFPATSEEYARWEAESRYWRAKCESTPRREAETQPLPTLLQEEA